MEETGKRQLQVKGIILKPGSFKDAFGIKVIFSEDSIKNIYNKLVGSVNLPIIIDHMGDPRRVGFATKYELKNNNIYYQGYIFDQQEKVLSGGYLHNSGELNVDLDVDGYVKDAELYNIALCKSPKIEGADITSHRSVAMGNTEGEKKMAEENVQEKENAVEPTIVKEIVKEGPSPEMIEEMAEMERKLKTLENKNKVSEERLLSLKREEMDAKINELSELGMDCKDIIKDKDPFEALDILNNMKEALVIGKAKAKEDETKSVSELKSNISEDIVRKTIEELGFEDLVEIIK